MNDSIILEVPQTSSRKWISALLVASGVLIFGLAAYYASRSLGKHDDSQMPDGESQMLDYNLNNNIGAIAADEVDWFSEYFDLLDSPLTQKSWQEKQTSAHTKPSLHTSVTACRTTPIRDSNGFPSRAKGHREFLTPFDLPAECQPPRGSRAVSFDDSKCCVNRTVVYNVGHRYLNRINTSEYAITYVKNLKAASSSIGLALNRNDPPCEVMKWGQKNLDCLNSTRGNFVFSFVRDPIARLVSAYDHLERHSGARGPFYDTIPYFSVNDRRLRFRTFVENVVENAFNPHVVPQNWHFRDGHGGMIPVDFLGRVENMAADWATLQVLLQRHTGDPSFQLPLLAVNSHFNQRYKKTNASEFLDDELTQRICRFYREDYQCFGYTFPAACAHMEDLQCC